MCLLLATTGCGRITRTKQCRALIARTNPALDDVLTLTQGNVAVGGGGSYVTAAGRYERLAKELGPLEFESEEMAKSVAEYSAVLTAAAQSLKALATAVDAGNVAEAERLNRDLDRTGGHERAVVSRMNAWCQP